MAKKLDEENPTLQNNEQGINPLQKSTPMHTGENDAHHAPELSHTTSIPAHASEKKTNLDTNKNISFFQNIWNYLKSIWKKFFPSEQFAKAQLVTDAMNKLPCHGDDREFIRHISKLTIDHLYPQDEPSKKK